MKIKQEYTFIVFSALDFISAIAQHILEQVGDCKETPVISVGEVLWLVAQPHTR
jgi:hypothetical protein